MLVDSGNPGHLVAEKELTVWGKLEGYREFNSWVRERKRIAYRRAYVCACVYVCAYVRARAHVCAECGGGVCVCARVCVCVSACVRIRDREQDCKRK